MHHKSDQLAAEELKRLYWCEELSLAQIGKTLGISTETLARRMDQLGIPRRSLSQAHKVAYRTGRKVAPTYHGRGSWKGGRLKTKDGYVLVRCPSHPRARGGYVFEHILVWEHRHDKPLPEGWVIHHLNGFKDDNRAENLVAMPRGKHIHLAEPYKKRIRQLEVENVRLRQTLEQSQLIFYVNSG